MEGFGPHLTLDLNECDSDKLVDVEFLTNLLREVPGKFGMKAISEPVIKGWLDEFAKTPGYTGFVILAESHFSLHTFPDSNYVFLDIFSCRGFDVETAADYLIKVFGSKKFEKNVIQRGKDFVA